MPTVKTREFSHTAKSGEKFQFKAPIAVDVRGVFSVNLPEELVVSAQAYLQQPAWKGHVTLDKARVNWRVQGRVLAEVERFIEDVLAEHLAVEVKEELVSPRLVCSSRFSTGVLDSTCLEALWP